MRDVLVVLLFVASGLSCGGQVTEPLSATFPLGGRELRLAVQERFPESLTPDDVTWPADAAAVALELEVVRGAIVDLSAAQARFDGRTLKTWPATLHVEGGANPLEVVELLGGPFDAAGVTADGVVLLGHGQPLAGGAPLVWTEAGAAWLAAALQGAHAAQAGVAKFSLFLRGRARVALEPGGPLPPADVESNIVVSMPVRYGP